MFDIFLGIPLQKYYYTEIKDFLKENKNICKKSGKKLGKHTQINTV